MTNDDSFVTVVILYDPMRAQLAEKILADADIPCTIQGAKHAQALAPIGGGFIPVPVQVRRSQAAEAHEVLVAFGLIDAAHGPLEPKSFRPETHKRVNRSRIYNTGSWPGLVAIWLLLQSGAAHFYAREFAAGWVVLITQWTAFFVMVTGHRLEAMGALFAVLILSLYDLIDGLRALRRFNDNRPLRASSQATRAGLVVCVAFAVATIPVLYEPDLHRDTFGTEKHHKPSLTPFGVDAQGRPRTEDESRGDEMIDAMRRWAH